VPLFMGFSLSVFFIALIALFTFLSESKKTETPRVVTVSSYSEQDNITERIKDILFLIENIFSSSEMREILSSNLFLFLNQSKIDELTAKFDSGTLTTEEKNYIKGFYEDVARYGIRVYPEAGQILRHYIRGDGSDLEISSKYFFESPFIKNVLENNKNQAIIGPVYIKTSDDPRIAYAVNGFYIRNSASKKEIYQYIDYPSEANSSAYTFFEFRGIRARLPHRLIKVFEEDDGCKGFTVYITEASCILDIPDNLKNQYYFYRAKIFQKII